MGMKQSIIMVCSMYSAPLFFSDQKIRSTESRRKEARYELASLLQKERFEEAVRLADSYLMSAVIRPEDHTFVIEIATAAKTLSQGISG
jgi:hypothetical protein